uniref:Uncharacterized protein n=1 Tax=Anopheles dirus TaxID=7168 RepID=A0A182NXS0_9DIPT
MRKIGPKIQISEKLTPRE